MSINVYKLERSTRPIVYALQTYFGIGQQTASYICKLFGITPFLFMKFVPKRKIKQIYQFMDRYVTVETELRTLIDVDVQKLMRIKSFRGIRLEKGLPVRGQRARTNGNTQRRRPIKKIHQDILQPE